MHESLIRAGAILPEGTAPPADMLLDTLVARQFQHDAVAGPIVRLTTEAITEGVDLEMEFLGFDSPEDLGPVGSRRREKLGFPGWALVHDPEHGRYALQVVKELKAALRRIKSKPGFAKDAVVALAERLAGSVPHFLPSFYEEVAWAFVAAENLSFAGQMFERARRAERVYALDVSLEMREQTFVDFALAKVLSVKSLTNYGAELLEHGITEEAMASYERICVRRTRGGLPPSATMLKDLKRLAKALGQNQNDAIAHFLEQVVSAPAMKQAAAGFWKACRAVLIKLAKQKSEVRGGLLDLFPRGVPAEEWLGLLDASGVLDALYGEAEPAARSAMLTGQWLSKLFVNEEQRADVLRLGQRTFDLLERCKTRLLEDGEPLATATGWNRHSPDLVETCLRLGIPLKAPDAKGSIVRSWSVWSQREADACLDWTHIKDSEIWAPLAIYSIESGWIDGWVDKLDTHPGFKEIVGRWLDRFLGRFDKHHGMPGAYDTLKEMSGMSARFWSHFPKQRERVAAVSLARPLKVTLNHGFPGELTWPAYTEALERFAKLDAAKLTTAWPFVAVFDKLRAVVIGPEGVVLEHEFQASKHGEITDVMYSQGAAMVVARKGWSEHYAYWTSDGEWFQVEGYSQYRNSSVQAPDGRMLYDGALLTPGDRVLGESKRPIHHDGARYWVHDSTWRSYDPLTGAVGEPGLPRGAEAGSDGSFFFVAGPPPASVVTTDAGLFGVVFTRDSEGNAHCASLGEPSCTVRPGTVPLRFPGASEPIYYSSAWRGFELTTADGIDVATSHPKFRVGLPMLGHPFWVNFIPKDARGSEILRTLNLETAEALTDLVRALPEGDADADVLERGIADVLPSISSELRKALAGVLQLLAVQQHMLDGHQGKASNALAGDAYAKTDPAELSDACSDIFQGTGTGYVLSEIREVAGFFTGDGETYRPPTGDHGWTENLGMGSLLAYRVLLPEVADQHRAALLTLLDGLAETPFVGPRLDDHLRRGAAPSEDDDDNAIVFPCRAGAPEDADWLSRYEGSSVYSWTRWSTTHFLEYAPNGEFKVVGRGPRRPFGNGWGNTAQVAELRRLVETRGAIDIMGAVPHVAEATGLTAEEALVWLGGEFSEDRYGRLKPKTFRWAHTIITSDAARKSDVDSQIGRQRKVFADCMLGEPLADLWDPIALAERASAAWLETHAKLPPVDSALLARMAPMGSPYSRTVRGALSPDMLPEYNHDRTWFFTGSNLSSEGVGLSSPTIGAPLTVFYFAPVGDVTRGIGSLLAKQRERLRADGYMTEIAHIYENIEEEPWVSWLAEFKDKPRHFRTDPDKELAARQRGEVVVLPSGWSIHAYATVDAILARTPEVLGVLGHSASDASCRVIDYIFSKSVDAFIERAANSPVPDGRYEADPRVSAHEVVVEVCNEYDLPEDAAALYLQLLTLANPSDANVRRWNGWKKKGHDAAIAPLVARELVIEAKRARAGRKQFVGGYWHDKSGDRPIEAWKFKHLDRLDDHGGLRPGLDGYDGELAPPHLLFARAWQRIKDGDEPRYEEPPS